MFWCDELLKRLDNGLDVQIINDSKTPSGRVHVGALRGVLIHDAVFRVLKEEKVAVRYLYGVDDYDPLDELPAGNKEFFAPYLGMPLCNVPAPPGSDAPDIAHYFISEFFDVFKELGVEPEIYHMRDVYRAGRFNEAIDRILRNAEKVRQIYLRVSGSERAEHWYPFQAICESCGRIGTSEVFDYDGKEVSYRCRTDLVSWATGCGYEGKISPFDGNGKLPWKLEWVAKWAEFPVSIEGAGKDHSTKGGSRDVSGRILGELFSLKPPVNIPYEFFLVGGAKMSSSKGLGVSAREMADFLPPELLRFLMIRPRPNKPVNFEPDEMSINKLFNEYDRYHHKVTGEEQEPSLEDRRIYDLSDIRKQSDYYAESFQTVTALVQMPHLNVEEEVAKRKGSQLTAVEKDRLADRVKAASYWLNHYAKDDEKLVLQPALPESAERLSHTQRAFLHQLADRLPEVDWDESSIQGLTFEVARLTPLKQSMAFAAIYCVLLDKSAGPKAGNLLAFLDRAFVTNRFLETSFDMSAYLNEAAMSYAEFDEWSAVNESKISSVSVDEEIKTEFVGIRFTSKERVQRIWVKAATEAQLTKIRKRCEKE